MPHVPPIVHAQHIHGVAYLLGWERMPVANGGGWGALIGWVELDDTAAWKLRGGTVPANTVRQVPGQDYSQVPRDPRPRDPSDPRGPDRYDRKYRPEDRAYFEAMMRRYPDDGHRERMRRMDGDF